MLEFFKRILGITEKTTPEPTNIKAAPSATSTTEDFDPLNKAVDNFINSPETNPISQTEMRESMRDSKGKPFDDNHKESLDKLLKFYQTNLTNKVVKQTLIFLLTVNSQDHSAILDFLENAKVDEALKAALKNEIVGIYSKEEGEELIPEMSEEEEIGSSQKKVPSAETLPIAPPASAEPRIVFLEEGEQGKKPAPEKPSTAEPLYAKAKRQEPNEFETALAEDFEKMEASLKQSHDQEMLGDLLDEATKKFAQSIGLESKKNCQKYGGLIKEMAQQYTKESLTYTGTKEDLGHSLKTLRDVDRKGIENGYITDIFDEVTQELVEKYKLSPRSEVKPTEAVKLGPVKEIAVGG